MDAKVKRAIRACYAQGGHVDNEMESLQRGPYTSELRVGPAPTLRDRAFDTIYGWLGGTPDNRKAAEQLTNIADVATLGIPTGIDEGAREFAKSGSPAMLAMSVMPGAKIQKGLGALGEAAATKGIRAYHGSPHDFDKFSLDHIGKGEGAQAYGHGLYFAEAEDVARAYRERLTSSHPADNMFYEVDGKIIKDNWASKTPESLAAKLLYDRNNDKDAVSRLADKMISLGDGAADWAEVKRYVSSMGPVKFHEKLPGRLYEVRIDADPEDFLDWDRPLAEQGPKVQSVLRNTFGADTANDYGRYKPIDLREIEELAADMGAKSDIPVLSPSTPEGAKTWRDAGVVGVKYLDAGSRTAGEGSRNYVLFRDDIIEVIRKYGVAAAASMYGAEAVNSVLKPRSNRDDEG